MVGTLRFSLASNWFRRAGLFKRVTERPISRSPPCRHARQHWHQLIDIVDDDNLGLCGMLAVEATDILSQRAFPGYGHREEERVEPLIVKTLTKIAPRGEDEPFLVIGHSKGSLGNLALSRRHPAPEDNEIAHEAGKAALDGPSSQ